VLSKRALDLGGTSAGTNARSRARGADAMAKEKERDLGRLGMFYFGIIAKDVKKEKRGNKNGVFPALA
jgi:hypothetical protein